MLTILADKRLSLDDNLSIQLTNGCFTLPVHDYEVELRAGSTFIHVPIDVRFRVLTPQNPDEQ